MKRLIKNIVSVIYTFLYFSLTKIFNWRNFKFSLIERFSPSVEVTLSGRHCKITIGEKVTAHSGVKIKALSKGKILLDYGVRLNYGCMIVGYENIHIGKEVGFGPNVLLFDNDHDYRVHDGVGRGATKFRSGPIEIGERTWIGANVIILRNTKIGKNCVVAAGCVLGNCEFPDNSLIYQKRDTQIKVIPR